MRLASTGDTDIRLDSRGQPMADNDGEPQLVTGMDCWMQDIWLEMLTEEGEILHEDEEGRFAYGYGLREFLNAEYDEETKAEVEARIREKLTKREYIEENSIQVAFSQGQEGIWAAHVTFAPELDDDEEESSDVTIDIIMDGEEVLVT